MELSNNADFTYQKQDAGELGTQTFPKATELNVDSESGNNDQQACSRSEVVGTDFDFQGHGPVAVVDISSSERAGTEQTAVETSTPLLARRTRSSVTGDSTVSTESGHDRRNRQRRRLRANIGSELVSSRSQSST